VPAGALLDGRTAIVTGGASGIGRAIALACARHGASVVVADVRETPREGGEATHACIERAGGRAAFVSCDVARPEQIEAAVAAADRFGGVDVLVCNAAVGCADDFDCTPEEFDRSLAVNVGGYFHAARSAARRMREKGGGSIVLVGSVEALEGVGLRPVYGLTRGAVRQLTFALADRLGPDRIRVNAVHPGLVETALTTHDIPIFGSGADLDAFLQRIPLRRAGVPDDIAEPVVFLASDRAAYVNGAELVVDGGMTYSW